MRLLPRGLGARLRVLLGPDAASVRQGLVALLIASAGGFLAGLTLGSLQHTLERLPGLLVLVPAAIGMRGNVFGALGSRLGTTIHTGTFRLSPRLDTVVGQNVVAAMALSLGTSLALAVLAKGVAVAFGLDGTISIVDFVVISVVAGALSSVVVLAITVAVAAAAVRYGWDLDNVAAPLVTAAGDVVTLPAIFLATLLVGIPFVTVTVGVACVAVCVAAVAGGLRSRRPVLRSVFRESAPVLVMAGALDVVAGLSIEKRLDHFLALPALLVLLPPFLEDVGALGGILASRLGSKLHLGVVTPSSVPSRAARAEIAFIAVLAAPVCVFVGVVSHLAATVGGLASPGLLTMVQIAVMAGALTLVATVVVTYYGSIAVYRLGLDPDNHGIPLVASSMDLVGALAVVLAVAALGLG